jgi:hypothetical protein
VNLPDVVPVAVVPWAGFWLSFIAGFLPCES